MLKEAYGNLWSFRSAGEWVCITTNGSVTKACKAVMGRGCAAQALSMVGKGGLKEELGTAILNKGNHLYEFQGVPRLLAFPVKHEWHQNADLDLIQRSAIELIAWLNSHPEVQRIYLPRPGCGNGHLEWAIVKQVLDEILDDRVLVTTFENILEGVNHAS